jgi:hypothetical protein
MNIKGSTISHTPMKSHVKIDSASTMSSSKRSLVVMPSISYQTPISYLTSTVTFSATTKSSSKLTQGVMSGL